MMSVKMLLNAWTWLVDEVKGFGFTLGLLFIGGIMDPNTTNFATNFTTLVISCSHYEL